MKHKTHTKHLLSLLCILLISTSSCAQSNDDWYIFQIEDIPLNLSKVYVDKSTIRSEIHNLSHVSTLKASKFDRMLFVVDGSTDAKVNSEILNLESGDVLFVKANDIIQFSRNIKMMLWTSKSTKTNHKSKTEKFSKKQIESNRDSSENVWNSFIETSTMVAGLYMLPKELNGDDTLIHDFDEINYVVNGSAKFKMNDTVIDVEPGSIMWVKRGVSHYFYDLSDDFDIFILFETINMNHDH